MTTETAQRTPGPWRLVDGGTASGLREYHVVGPDRFNEADARLIAAAPELLAALEGLYEALRDDSYSAHNARYWNVAREAIAKARA